MAIKHPDHWKKEYEHRLMQIEMEQRMIDQNMMGQAMGSIIGTSTAQGIYQDYQNVITNGTGLGQMVAAMQQAQQPIKYELGTLYLNAAPLPDDWRGAQIDRIARSVTGEGGPRWIFNFHSKWSKDVILLHLDAEELSGKEAMRVAETYKEALNQRRVG